MSTTVERPSTAEKLARLEQIIERRNLDAAVVCSYQNVSYYAGTFLMTQTSLPDRLAFLILPKGKPPTLVVCGIETSMVRTQTEVADLRDYVEFVDNPTEVLAGILREKGLAGGSIGVDARRLPMAAGDLLKDSLQGVERVSVDDDIELAQAVKDRVEIDTILDA